MVFVRAVKCIVTSFQIVLISDILAARLSYQDEQRWRFKPIYYSREELQLNYTRYKSHNTSFNISFHAHNRDFTMHFLKSHPSNMEDTVNENHTRSTSYETSVLVGQVTGLQDSLVTCTVENGILQGIISSKREETFYILPTIWVLKRPIIFSSRFFITAVHQKPSPVLYIITDDFLDHYYSDNEILDYSYTDGDNNYPAVGEMPSSTQTYHCLSVLFTARSITQGLTPVPIYGLGYTPNDESPNTGICSTKNVAFVNLYVSEKVPYQPNMRTKLVFSHEVAHAFGAPHDNDETACGEYTVLSKPDAGYFLMHEVAVTVQVKGRAVVVIPAGKTKTSPCISTHNDLALAQFPELNNILKTIAERDKWQETSIRLPVGTPCDRMTGYCDVFQRCRGVDPDTPLTNFERCFEQGKECGSLFLDFLSSEIGALILATVTGVLITLALVKCLTVHTKSSNPDLELKHPHRSVRESVTSVRYSVVHMGDSVRTSVSHMGRSMRNSFRSSLRRGRALSRQNSQVVQELENLSPEDDNLFEA
ncbi:ADA10-like protein [Mya arenaria]|uniref:ADA10-like protein n=1 Tax=Mya arenaria TaxID=6604 RepID=A0ABY7EGB7_MYAAR|nr:ADA10-like protein [Mya arenaria]